MDHPRLALAGTAALASVAALLPGGAVQATTPGAAGRVAFVSVIDSQEQIVTSLPDGSDLGVISDGSGRDFDPAWSPDGARLAFASTRAGEGHVDIWVADADGSDPLNLTPGAVTTGQANSGVEPTWSPDGSTIAYTYEADVWTIPSTGGSEVNLMPGTGANESGINPAWSPDGTRIAFVRNGDIWVMDADGGDPTPLTSTPLPAAEKYPDWSPDGARLLYERQGQIWRMYADGSGQQLVAGGPDRGGTRPEWSPEGDRIVFSSAGYSAPNEPDIFTAAPDGRHVDRLVTGTTYSDQSPSWQPAPGGAPWGTYTTVAVDVAKRTIMVTGDVFPALPGRAVEVTLLRKTADGFVRAQRATEEMGQYGGYASVFKHPKAKKCRVVAVFEGTGDRSPSRARKTFAC